jgi:hypothetical protein
MLAPCCTQTASCSTHLLNGRDGAWPASPWCLSAVHSKRSVRPPLAHLIALAEMSHGLASGDGRDHFLRRCPSARRCRASLRPTASSAWRPRSRASSTGGRPRPPSRRTCPSTSRRWHC